MSKKYVRKSKNSAPDAEKKAREIAEQRANERKAIREHPNELADIWAKLYAHDDRLDKLEHPKRGRMRDEVTAQLEQFLQHARDVIDDIQAGAITADRGKHLLKRYVHKQEIAAAKSRGTSDPGGAAKMSRKRNKPKP